MAQLQTSDDLLICNECGVQYPVTAAEGKDECKTCEDPRQYVPATGQAWTTLGQLKREGRRNVWLKDSVEEGVWCVQTEPKFAIGERAILIQTAKGNILWDLISFLDQETVDRIEGMGGLKAIVISHPHYYSTWSEWSRTFHCPVYVGKPDEVWLERVGSPNADIRFLTDSYTDILEGSGATAILAGGHFPGSLLLHWNEILFIADTLLTSPSATNPVPDKYDRHASFTFLWSIPNRIPLHPDDILAIWKVVKPLEFHTALGAFAGQDVRTTANEAARRSGGMKGRVLRSCQVYVKAMGWQTHGIFEETM